ncbi:MAG TPA: beta-ketoacyl synthase chain length factor [Opitutus sp.]|nr:beta-ketoacyl synthase chain length factor [Opitutus sp.]
MLERYVHALGTHDAGLDAIGVTRERFKDRFPKLATRRMTHLGLLVAAALDDLSPAPADAVVYASTYAETRALEDYLDSFPTASPTLFQTSIHPSAVQQALIGRQTAIGEFLPLTGRAHLVGAAFQAALLSPAPRVLLCGGEERATWLLDQSVASDRSFAFALALAAEPPGALARVQLAPVPDKSAAELNVPQFFDALVARRPLDLVAAPGLHLSLTWL